MGNGLNNGDYKKSALFPWESNSKNSDRISAWMVEDTGTQFRTVTQIVRNNTTYLLFLGSMLNSNRKVADKNSRTDWAAKYLNH